MLPLALRFVRALTAVLLLALAGRVAMAQDALAVDTLKTYSVMGKGEEILSPDKEVELLRHPGRGCLTHMWFAMDERVRVRVYVDGEASASIDMALDLGHGYAFGGPSEPFGNQKFGRYGAQFNNFRIPYGNGIRVTLVPMTRNFDGVTGRKCWWVLRGTENLPTIVGGLRLPDTARLRLITHEEFTAQPLQEFALCDVKGKGMLYLVTMSARGAGGASDGNNLAYMEGCMRGYMDGAAKPEMLSSGLEDYFLSSGYFHHNTRYYGQVAGLTHIDKAANAFSAYRFHDDDPVVFRNGFRLTCRCGEEKDGKPLFDPRPTHYSTYTWLYVW